MPANDRVSQVNSSRILRELWLNPGLSRVDIARRLNLDKSTITISVKKMIDMGILLELKEQQASAKGGRRPLALGINESFGYFMGIELMADSLRIAIVNLQGDLLEEEELFGKSKMELKALAEWIRTIHAGWSEKYSILGLGIAISGMVDPFRGELLQSVLLEQYEPIPLVSMIDVPCPVIIENDANSCAWGELVSQRSRGLEDFLYVLVESPFFEEERPLVPRFSIGMSLVMEGKVYHGKNFSAGEFRSLRRQRSTASQLSMDLEELALIKDNGEIRHRLFQEIASHLAFLANSLNLKSIFVGGDISPFWGEFRVVLDDEVQKNWSYPDRAGCRFMLAGRGSYAGAYGAAAMHLERVFAANHGPFYQDRNQKIGLDLLQRED